MIQLLNNDTMVKYNPKGIHAHKQWRCNSVIIKKIVSRGLVDKSKSSIAYMIYEQSNPLAIF